MTKKVLRAISFVALAISGCQAFAGEIDWVSSYDAARVQAKKTNKLTMVFFYADWCTYSQKMKATSLQSPNVRQAAEGVVAVKVNAEKEGAGLKSKWGVKMYPSFVFVTPSGEKFSSISGYMASTVFGDEIRKVTSAYREMPALIEAYRRSPGDGEINARLAWLYGIRGQETTALKYLTTAKRAKYRGPHLAKAYNMIGDIFQLSDRIDTAMEYFEFALETSKTPEDSSYSLVSLVSCSSTKNDRKSVERFGRRLLSLPGATPEYVKFTRDLFKRLGIENN